MIRCFSVAAAVAVISALFAGDRIIAGEMHETVCVVSWKAEYKTVTFEVSMHCHNCVKKLNDTLPFEKGVKALDVSLEKKTVKITFDPSKTDIATLQKAIEKFGYTVKVIK